MKGTKWMLKARDLLKGLFMAVATPVLYVLQELIPHYHLHPIAQAGISAGIAYLIKNWFTDDVKAAQKILAKARLEAEENQQKNYNP